ncbi:MAG: flagellar biosynthesis repressor FlbT [Pseudomonadota bacterium]
MPLKLTLKPGETFILNGAVVRNGDRRGTLLLENQARILREKDIMQPEDANTPTRRVYFAIMQMYLLGENEGPAYDRTMRALADLLAVTPAADTRDTVTEISAAVSAGELYKALAKCRKLVQREDANSVDREAS